MQTSLTDRVIELIEEIESEGCINTRQNLSDQERIAIDEKYAELTHREALALSLSKTPWDKVRSHINNGDAQKLKQCITKRLLTKADSIIQGISPDIGIVSIFDELCYPEILEELCDEAPLVFFFRIDDGLDQSARIYVDSVLKDIPSPCISDLNL